MSNDLYRPVPAPLAAMRGAVRRGRRVRSRAMNPTASLSFGRDSVIGPGAKLLCPSSADIADEVSIGASFHCETNLVIGSGSVISSRVAIVGNDHDLSDPAVTPFRSKRNPPASVSIGAGCFIGFGVTIVGSIRIGDGAVVGAGAVVVRDVEPWTVVAGVPARLVRHRNETDKQGQR
jgi:acetyltransferase-like isoleucine patch superfamily enzyme